MDQGDLATDVAAIAGIAAVPTILEVLCRTTGMGFAAVARVTEDRWIACSVRDEIAFGLQPGGELKVETTICQDVRRSSQRVVINHVAEDQVWCGHPVPAMYGFQSYISVPITLPDGSFFGTLCAIDPRPRVLDTPETTGMFVLFAELIAFHLNALKRIDVTEANLAAERETARLREQFVAVLAHDLRNPLTAIFAGLRMIGRTPINEKAAGALVQMQRSVSRMSDLITNVLDFARFRLGGGMPLELAASGTLEATLSHVLSELRAIWPDRMIESDMSLTQPVICDQGRIGQLFSNLLGNALTHGSADKPVRVRARTEAGLFKLAIANAGPPISEAAQKQLFEPFVRGSVKPNQQGLGLGLYIASEIARAHGGTIALSSLPTLTEFTVSLPLTGGLPVQP